MQGLLDDSLNQRKSNIVKGFDGDELEKGGQGSGRHQVGATVQVHPQLTSDPNKRQGETGKVSESHEDHAVVKFSDGKQGKYQHDALISKANSDDLEKGEGSRGGHIIGHTRSGKPIYSGGADHKEHKNFSARDHYDAAEVHEKIASDKRVGAELGINTSDRHKMRDQADKHDQMASEHNKAAVKSSDIGPEHKAKVKEIGGTKGLFKHFVNNPEYVATHHEDKDEISVKHVASGRHLSREEILKMTKGK